MGRQKHLDTWRTISVTLVILAHLSHRDDLMKIFSDVNLDFMFSYGNVGVYIFFFISGYVVSSSCLKEIRAHGSLSMPAFYVRRIFRILPPLVLYLISLTILDRTNLIKIDASSLIGAFVYICNTTIVSCGWYAGHTWSLAFEEQFYLIFPLIIVYIELSIKPKLYVLCVLLFLAAIPFFYGLHFIGKTGFIIIHLLFMIGYLCAKYEHLYKGLLSTKIVNMAFIFGMSIRLVSTIKNNQLAR